MAELINRYSVAFSSTLDLNEAELRALEALTSYSDKAFLEVFYEHLGTSCLKPNEAGLKSLFEAIRTTVKPALRNIDEARKMLKREDPN